MLLVVVTAAAGFAAGVWLVLSAVWPPRPTLVAALEHLHASPPPRALLPPATATVGSIPVRLGRWLLARARGAGVADEATVRDLELVSRPVELYAGTCVLGAAAGAAAGPLLWAVAAGAGLPSGLLVPAWLSLAGAAAGFVAPRLVLRAQAARARTDFRHALSAYLDLLVLLLAAGEGPEGAMETAAHAGTGPAFLALRRATAQARLSGQAVWATLDDLGRRVGITEVREVAAAGHLAGERGAAVRRSLLAKTRALRAASLAAAEAAARRRSQAMFAPVALIGTGFVVFVLYPLVTNIRLT